jgi:GT2 family glycosyltransferase
VPDAPTASIIVPTRERPEYLEVTLRSIGGQASAAGAEILVVQDGPDPATAAVAERHGARVVSLPRARGANAARNAGIAAARSDLFVLVDDDIEAAPGWLERLLEAAQREPGFDVFGGPITPRLEGTALHGCGREPAPITALDLGQADRQAEFVWSANMAVRRAAVERVGEFDETIFGRGDEEDWQRRLAALGGRVLYVAGAGVAHRRAGRDARVPALCRANYFLGRCSRRYDVRKHTEPSLGGEFRVLAGCMWHTLRRRCAFGIVMTAHRLGRLRELLAERRMTSDQVG